jgi:glycosyltransferase involved in cell wall biosynthesis
MKIALIAPSPVPFTSGGTESMVIEIQRLLNTQTFHQCEIIKIPTREGSFWELIESYHAFYSLDLSHFDAVISTKYPSWMVNHPSQILYLVHPFRQVYDLYYKFSQPNDLQGFDRYQQVQDILEMTRAGDEKTSEIFDLLFSIRKDRSMYPKSLFNFPGPFLRAILRYFDRCALSTAHICRYYAISDHVKTREGYFPSDVPITVLYPPTRRCPCPERLHPERFALSVSRLANTKRIDLLIRAMDHVNPDIHLKIVGEGPEEKKLRKLAKNNKRIEFLGFIRDKHLQELYSSAFCLLFVPKDEEYGLVIPEAMRCRKPVITTEDSGGPLELVQNGANGYIVSPDPKKIAEKMTYLYENPQYAREMGELGSSYIKGIEQEFLKEIESEFLHLNTPARKKFKIPDFF